MRQNEFLCHHVNVLTDILLSSRWRAWDFHPEVGLFMAGANSITSDKVEISENGGLTFRKLPDVPYTNKVYGACAVIIDEERIFIAGGIKSRAFNHFADLGFCIT